MKHTTKTVKTTHNKKQRAAAFLAGALLLTFTACGSEKQAAEQNASKEQEQTAQLETIKVGATPAPHAEILTACKEALAEKGYELVIVEFTDYELPNRALAEGDLDANFFQHQPFLDNFNKSQGEELATAAAIHFEPMGIYSGKSSDLAKIPQGAVIAVPSDTSNEGRALQLLEAQGIIELNPEAGLHATARDITKNPYHIKLEEMEAAQLPRTLQDVDFAVINGNYALQANVGDALLVTESKESEGAKTYANVVAVQPNQQEEKKIKALVEVLTSQHTKDFISQKYGDSVIPVFE